MPDRKTSAIFQAFLFLALAAATCAVAQPENLTAQLLARESETEQRVLLENRTAAELKTVVLDLIKESTSPELIKDSNRRIQLLNLARATAERVNFHFGEARALIGLGQASFGKNEPEAGLQFFELAARIAEKCADRADEAELLNSIAFSHQRRADYDRAIEFATRSLRVFEAAGDTKRTAHMHNAIGAAHVLRGDYTAAEAAHLHALEITTASKDLRGIIGSAFHLGIVNRFRGNYGEALRFYHKAREIGETLPKTDAEQRDALSTTLRHIGGTYFLQGNLRLADDYANQSLALDRAANSREAVAHSIQFLARIRFAEKNFKESQKLSEQVLPVYEELGMREGVAGTLAILGITHAAQGENETALDYFRRALKIREESGSRDGAAFARIHMANILTAQGKPQEAVALAALAANSALLNGNRELLWQAQTALGRANAALVDCDKARENFDQAIATIENLRGEVVGGAGESSLFFAEKVKPYQNLAAMLAEQNDFAAAFEYAERAKARVLLDSLRFGRNQPTATMTTDERAEENRLRGELVALNAQISRAADKEKAKDLQTRLDAARVAFQRFQTNLYAAHPELKIRRGAIAPIKAGEIGDLLDERTALIEYLVTDDQTLLFVFAKTDGQTALKTYQIKIGRGEIGKKINRFRQMLAESNLLFASESCALYDLLLKPAAEQLKNKTNLVIVPDDGLWELPFQALQSAENRYLLDDAAISYAPSLTILREQTRGASAANPNPNILALGNPLDGRGGIKINFAALPEAERQTAALKTLYGAKNSLIFTRGAASEAVFKRESGKFSILHLATHGVLDNASPLNSYVLLAPGAAGDDGRLEAWEILEMNLPAEMVMLSACETARGQARSGEGLVGLAWSLMVAGTRSVVVSQWKVESASTTDLTTEFYKNLRQKTASEKAESLRQAALKLRRDGRYSHPFYWAGFVLIGETK